MKSTAITVGPYGVAQGATGVDSPDVDGYVVGMSADLVDANGNVVPNMDVMLHHVVFAKVLYPDYTCRSFQNYDGSVSGLPVQRFYAEGEEHSVMALPAGFGYPNKGTDVWGLVYMLMNHHAEASTVFVRYTVHYVTGESLKAVEPVWFDIRNCRADPVFNVPGTGGGNSTLLRHADFRMPESGVFVAGGAHLHGGGKYVSVSNLCGGRPHSLFTSYPTWGGTMPTPVMHEPGPVAMSQFADSDGRMVRARDVVRIEAAYDNSRPHVRVMGISLMYFFPESVPETGSCREYTSPTVPATMPEDATVELLKQPTGKLHRNITGTLVTDAGFGAQRVQLRRGARFTWRFAGSVPHDVTLATGPVGFSSPSRATGSYSFRFTRPGVYRLFCSLHPAQLTEVVRVR